MCVKEALHPAVKCAESGARLSECMKEPRSLHLRFAAKRDAMRKAKGIRVSCHKMGKVWQGEAPEAKAETHGMGGDLKTLCRKDSFLCFPGFALSVGKLVRWETLQKRFLYAVYEERPAGIFCVLKRAEEKIRLFFCENVCLALRIRVYMGGFPPIRLECISIK